MTKTLTPASLELFISFARDAANWGGTPLVDGLSAAERGNLTDLKKAGLLRTFEDEGCMFAEFSAEGKALASEHGIEV